MNAPQLKIPPIDRPQRTFKLRRRGIGDTRVDSYQRLSAIYGVSVEGDQLNLGSLFIRPDPGVVLDIGFGYGDALIELARTRRDECVIAVEVHTPGVVKVLEEVELYQLDNVRVVEGDAMEFLPRLPLASLHEVRVWFPDPWIKRRQHGRRIISASFVQQMCTLLVDGGYLHLVTDIADYARQMRSVCDAQPSLSGGVVPRPDWRPVTGYEARGQQAGRAATDLIYRRVSRSVMATDVM